MTIFLDIDGVLNQLQYNYYLDDSCISILSEVCKMYDANVVLTSSWRLGYSHFKDKCTPQLRSLLNKFENYGIRVTSRTKNLGDRYLEVRDYIKEHNISSYIILDDDLSEFNTQDKFLYLVNCRTGLTKKDLKGIKKLLRG